MTYSTPRFCSPFGLTVTVQSSTDIGHTPFGPRLSAGLLRLPADPIGIAPLVLTGLKAGSTVHVFSGAGVTSNEVASSEAATGTLKPAAATSISLDGRMEFRVPVYQPGSALNDLRILVMNLAYEIIDINQTISSAGLIIPLFQRIDRNYRNPT